MKVGIFKQALCEEVVPWPECFMGMDMMSGWGTLFIPHIVKQKPVNEILVEDAVRNVRVDGIKLTVRAEYLVCLNRILMKWLHVYYLNVLWEWTLYLSREYFLQPSIIKEKVYKSVLQAVLIGPTKWEWIRLPRPTWYRLELECW